MFVGWVSKQDLAIERVHPVLAGQHAYVEVEHGRHVVTAKFAPGCLPPSATGTHVSQ